MKKILTLSVLLVSMSNILTTNAKTIAEELKPTADLVLVNATVYTVNDQQPHASTIAIHQGKITYVGDRKGVKKYIGANTSIQDMQKKLVLPGFQDAHVHPMEGASLETFIGCDLVDISAKVDDPELWIDEIKSCNDIPAPHNWILGGGHDHHQLMNLDRLPKEILDEAFPNKPAAFMEKSSHSMWVNSKALAMVGITKDTPHPQGGKIGKDAKTGEPTGILYDSAGDELMHKALAKTPKLQAARYQAILNSQELLAKHGITSAVNARVYWIRGNLEPWLKAQQQNTLKARNIMALWAYPHLDDDYQLKQLKAMYQNDKASLLRVNKVKFYSDGVPDLNSAAVLDPYGVLVHDQAEPLGGNYFTGKRLAKYITELEPTGFGAIIHAIGDRGTREALNAIEAANKANPKLTGNKRRHYITHVRWVSEQDIPRFAALNVPADTQMNYIDYEDYDSGDYYGDEALYDLLYANNKSNTDALPAIHKAGAKIVISSDWDVASIDPLFSIQNALQEFKGAMPKADIIKLAVKAYTLNAAYALAQEKQTGSIEVGKYADLIVLDQNIFTIPATTIRDTKVILTLLGGKEVYRATK
ncbi:MAG: amidohydrolase [Colwellia sp.]|nr:amidohydrolase [Colwellia sp.]